MSQLVAYFLCKGTEVYQILDLIPKKQILIIISYLRVAREGLFSTSPDVGTARLHLLGRLTLFADGYWLAAANLKREIDALANRYPNTVPVLLDVNNEQDLEKLIKANDLVIR